MRTKAKRGHNIDRIIRQAFRSIAGTSLQPSREDQHEQDDHHETKAAARCVPPAPVVRPRGNYAEEQQNQNYEQDSHA